MIGKLKSFFGSGNKDEGTATDPVCKMVVDKADPGGGTAEYQETTYYFCAPGCRKSFQQDPERHLD
jgi:YHS domain-containing protein